VIPGDFGINSQSFSFGSSACHVMADFVVPSQRLKLVQYLLELERNVEENDVAITQQLSNRKNITAIGREDIGSGHTWTV